MSTRADLVGVGIGYRRLDLSLKGERSRAATSPRWKLRRSLALRPLSMAGNRATSVETGEGEVEVEISAGSTRSRVRDLETHSAISSARMRPLLMMTSMSSFRSPMHLRIARSLRPREASEQAATRSSRLSWSAPRTPRPSTRMARASERATRGFSGLLARGGREGCGRRRRGRRGRHHLAWLSCCCFARFFLSSAMLGASFPSEFPERSEVDSG